MWEAIAKRKKIAGSPAAAAPAGSASGSNAQASADGTIDDPEEVEVDAVASPAGAPACADQSPTPDVGATAGDDARPPDASFRTPAPGAAAKAQQGAAGAAGSVGGSIDVFG